MRSKVKKVETPRRFACDKAESDLISVPEDRGTHFPRHAFFEVEKKSTNLEGMRAPIRG